MNIFDKNIISTPAKFLTTIEPEPHGRVQLTREQLIFLHLPTLSVECAWKLSSSLTYIVQ